MVPLGIYGPSAPKLGGPVEASLSSDWDDEEDEDDERNKRDGDGDGQFETLEGELGSGTLWTFSTLVKCTLA